MIDAQGFDPTLLAKRQADEKPELDQFRDGEVLMKFFPERVVGDIGIPGDRAGVGQRDFLALGKPVRVGEVEQLIVFLFRESLPSSLDGALYASIFALDRFGNVNAA